MESQEEVEESLSPFNFDLVEQPSIEAVREEEEVIPKLSPVSVPTESETIESEAQEQYIENDVTVPDMKSSI